MIGILRKLIAGFEISFLLVAASLKVKIDELPSEHWYTNGITWTQAHSLALTVLILISIIFLKFSEKLLLSRKSCLDVKAVLDFSRSRVFKSGNIKSDDEYCHRITAFEFKTNWIGKNYLKAFSRTGHQTQKLNDIFPVSSDGTLASGIAGKCWSKKAIVFVENLSQITASSPEPVLEDYSRKTFESVEELKQRIHQYENAPENSRREISRSFSATPIVLRNGKIWGVIVLDSTAPTAIKNPRVNGNKDLYDFMSQTISIIVDK